MGMFLIALLWVGAMFNSLTKKLSRSLAGNENTESTIEWLFRTVGAMLIVIAFLVIAALARASGVVL